MKVARRYGGFLLLTLIAFIPAYFAYRVGASANEVGMFYVGTLIWSLLGWNAYSYSRAGRTALAVILLLLALLSPIGAAYYYTAPAGDMILYGCFTILYLGLGWLALRLIESTEEAAL